jgi:sugar O-acyltransferase (sialic acid O-acetyltransferase NeuD family)
MNKEVVIFGAGGFAREVFSLLDDIGIQVRGFVAPDAISGLNLPRPLLGGDEIVPMLAHEGVVEAYLAIGDVRIRQQLYELAIKNGMRCPPLVHPNAVVLTGQPIGEASIIYPSVVIMTGCKIGKGVLINTASSLGHDVEIEDFSNVNPGVRIAGFVRIGKQSMVGIGSSVIEHVTIGERVVIGAGSLVIRDVLSDVQVFGVPAHSNSSI